jgi:hypothetical protein
MEDENFSIDEFLCPKRAFQAGVKYITDGAEKALAAPGEDWWPFLCAHIGKQWGYVDDDERRRNDEAVETGGRIRSIFKTKRNATIWVVTEADRSRTHFFLPEEYDEMVKDGQITSQPQKAMNQQLPKIAPVTVDEKLNDIIKRLGRIEMHLIAIRGPRPTKKEQ